MMTEIDKRQTCLYLTYSYDNYNKRESVYNIIINQYPAELIPNQIAKNKVDALRSRHRLEAYAKCQS